MFHIHPQIWPTVNKKYLKTNSPNFQKAKFKFTLCPSSYLRSIYIVFSIINGLKYM